MKEGQLKPVCNKKYEELSRYGCSAFFQRQEDPLRVDSVCPWRFFVFGFPRLAEEWTAVFRFPARKGRTRTARVHGERTQTLPLSGLGFRPPVLGFWGANPTCSQEGPIPSPFLAPARLRVDPVPSRFRARPSRGRRSRPYRSPDRFERWNSIQGRNRHGIFSSDRRCPQDAGAFPLY